MAAKHPAGSGPFEPRETEDPPPDVSLMENLLAQTDPLVGVGTRGLRPGHLKCLTRGQFHHEEARQAKEVMKELGRAYAGGRLPRWVTRSLNGGLLTPLVKKPPPEGQNPDARPTNARGIDVTLPLKAIQRKAGPALLRQVGPQQLGVGVKNGVELKILGMKMLICFHRADGTPFVIVLIDLKNAHNEYDRRKAQTALDEAAAADPELRDIARAHHADCGQPSDIYMRTDGPGGYTQICEGTAGGPTIFSVRGQLSPAGVGPTYLPHPHHSLQPHR